MKMNKITQFLKKNVFYVAMGIVIVGALVATLFLPKEGNVSPDSNVKNEQAAGSVTEDYEGAPVIVDDEMPADDAASEDEAVTDESKSQTTDEDQMQTDASEAVPEESTTAQSDENDEAAGNEQAADTKTFEDTTVAKLDTPYFADDDTFELPVQGKEVVPYTDDSTKYWFSETLNQTMRTYGVCLAADEGEEVKAVAQGTVLDIISDSSTLKDWDMPYVGKVMILDLGNGYKVAYGFQGGSPNEDLKGQVVNAGDVLGTAGSPAGPFVSEGDNIYLQLTHDDETVDPTQYLQVAEK